MTRQIGFASPSDAPAIAELMSESASAFDVAQELERRYARLWVARESEHATVVAVALCWEVADEVHLIDVMVAPAERRRGLARALLTALLEHAQRGPFATILLEVRRDNAPARALYEALGFEVVGEREKYYSDGEDAILMRRSLTHEKP